jgi:uncharacterized protein with NAD-binding domain and iron-sulfur cluster
VKSAFARAWYDGAFAYRHGDQAQPWIAAGISVRAVLNQNTGFATAPLWRFRSSMADTVVALAYQVLTERCVSFKFFHGVLDVRAEDGQVTEIDVEQQADLAADHYEPLDELGHWPNRPHDDQLSWPPDDELRERLDQLDFGLPTPDADQRTATLRLGHDFDDVVLAIPLPAHPVACASLQAANEPLRTAYDTGDWCMTQAVQLWLRKTVEELGWANADAVVSSTYHGPLNTWANMVRSLEDEPGHPPEIKTLAYFCGVLAGESRLPGGDRETAENTAAAVAEDLLAGRLAAVWPTVHKGNGSFDRGAIHSQYRRANWAPTEQYVQTPPGSIAGRVRPDGTGLRNLALAGDWTRTGIDLGCVEAAVLSGRLAAASLKGVVPPAAPG